MPAKKPQLSSTDGGDRESLSLALELIRTGEISEYALNALGVSREQFTPEMMALLAQQIEQVSAKPEAVAHPDFPDLVGRVENFTIEGFLKQYLEPLRPVLNKIYAHYQEKTQLLATESDSKVLELGFSDSLDVETVVGQKPTQVPALLSYFNAVSGANSEEKLALSSKDFEVTLREALDGVSLFQGNDFEWYSKNYAEVMQCYYTFRPEFVDPLKRKKTEDFYRVGQYVAGIYRSLRKIAKFAPGEYVALLEVDKTVISLFVNHENSDPVVTEYYLNLCDDLKRLFSSDDFNMDRKELETFYDYISLVDKKNSTKALKDAKTSVSKKIALRIIEKAASYFSSTQEIKRYLNLTDRIFEELVRSSISPNKYLTKLNVLLQKSRVDALSALSEMNFSVDDRGFIAKKLYEIQSYLSANAGGLTSITKLYFYERSVSIYFNFFKCNYEVNKNINALLVFLNETRTYREAISNIISSMPVSNVFERNLKYQTVKTLKSIIEKFINVKRNANEKDLHLLYQMLNEIQEISTLCKKLLPSNDAALSEFNAIKEAMLQKQQQSEIGEIGSKAKTKAPIKQKKNQKPSKQPSAKKKENNAAEKPSVSQEDAATLAWKQYYSDGVSLLLASEYDAAIQKFREGLEKFKAPKYKDAKNHFNFGIADAEVARFYKLKTKHIDIAKSSQLLEASCDHLRDFFDKSASSEIDEDFLAMLPDFFANMLFLRSIRDKYDQVEESVRYRLSLLTDSKSVRVAELKGLFENYNSFYKKTDEVLGIISRFRSSIIDSNGGLFDSMSSSMQRLFLYFDFMLFYMSGKFEFNNIGPNINDLEHVFNQLLNKVRLQYHPYAYLSSLVSYYNNYSSNFSKRSANHLLMAIKYAFKKRNSIDANFFQSVDRLLDSLVNAGFKMQHLGPDFASLFSNKFIFMLQSFSINKLIKCLECLMKLGFTYNQLFTDQQYKLLAHKLKKHKVKFPEPMLEKKPQAKSETKPQLPTKIQSRVEESYGIGLEQLFLDFDKIQLQENNSAPLERLLLSKNSNGHHALHAALLTFDVNLALTCIEKLNALLKLLKNKSDRDFLDFFCSTDSFGLSLTTYVLKLGNSVLTVEYFKLIEAAYVDYKLIDKSQFYYLLTARNELNQTPLLQIFHENNLDLLNYYCFIVDAHFSNGLGQDRNHVLKLLLQERQEMECRLQQWNSQLAFNAFLNQHGYYVIWQDPSMMGYTYSSDPAPINTQMLGQTETAENAREPVAETPHENEPPANQQVDTTTQSPEAAVSEPQQETSTVASESKEPEALISAEDQARLTACLKDYLASNNVEVKSERGKSRIKIVFSKEAVLAFDQERASFLKNIFDHNQSKIILSMSMQHISSIQTGQPVFIFKQVERGSAIEYMVTANKTNYQMFKNSVSLGNAGSQLQKEKAAQEKNTESNVQVSASESEFDEGNAPKSAETAGQPKVTQPKKSWAGLFASPEGHNKPSGNSQVLPQMGVVPMKK